MRYFLEVSYKGTGYSGFQTQKNANTIQSEIEKALFILLRQNISLTGSSRTDAGVHALQNYFHFNSDIGLHLYKKSNGEDANPDEVRRNCIYKLNAILPYNIVVRNLFQVPDMAHCRFDALSREYKYFIYQNKNPFLKDYGYFYPYKLDMDRMQAAAEIIKGSTDFISFSKKNTQVKSFKCNIYESNWLFENESWIYHIKANRFLRGMVRALVATMLKVGRGKLSIDEFNSIIEARDFAKASFAVPAHGLFLIHIQYPDGYFK